MPILQGRWKRVDVRRKKSNQARLDPPGCFKICDPQGKPRRVNIRKCITLRIHRYSASEYYNHFVIHPEHNIYTVWSMQARIPINYCYRKCDTTWNTCVRMWAISSHCWAATQQWRIQAISEVRTGYPNRGSLFFIGHCYCKVEETRGSFANIAKRQPGQASVS